MAFSIKTRLILMGTLVAVIPTIIAGLIISQNAVDKGTTTLLESTQKQLILSRDLTAQSIESYFSFIEKQATSLSSNNSTIAAANAFSKAFSNYPSTGIETSKLTHYYKNQYDQNYKNLNAGQSSHSDDLLAQLSPTAKAIQTTYIANNPSPLGQKDALTSSHDGTAYDDVHKVFHPMFHQFQQEFGFYDVFIADAKTGQIVYSVFKELDFGTSLLTGPYKNTDIASAFKKAVNGKTPSATYLTDFAPYGPSYNAAASFISSPIYDGNKMIAVLIFQMPIDRIDSVMAHNKTWEKNGLGRTGQTYLVGKDKIMRSNERLLLEDKGAFLSQAKNLGLSSVALDEVAKRDTTIGLIKVESQAVNNAITGKEGFLIEDNYLNTPALTAYKPLKIQDVQWFILSESHQAEAFEPIANLKNAIYTTLVIISVIAIIVGALLGLLLANIIVRPIDNMVNLMRSIAEGEGDLTQRLPTTSNDELTELAKGINLFINHIDKTFSSVLSSVVRLKPISEDMADVNSKLSLATEQQKTQAAKVNDCLSETNDATKKVEQELEQINKASKQGNTIVNSSSQVVNQVATTMEELSIDITQTVEALSKLKGDTDRIAGIIDVINSIAEQTNLLALNAAIEAARAGEAGRGFAVVADEVRSLASKTRQSTDEVASMVGAIQNGTLEVVKRMENSKTNAEQSSSHVKDATQSLSYVQDAMDTISDKVTHIANAITSQQHNFLEVTAHYDEMRNSFVRINEQSERSTLVGKDVVKLSDNVIAHINRFQVTDNSWSLNRRYKIRNESE
ncbi:methyl-accepting chemotaxis protein [Marinomonas sp. IMCC 4694]|uniref:methyl-accepting chemotaxis protein n=1 Tax=Marinomonas sp. IMCC 4694 TaxID=2605432 RepID=UPI0011E818DF|nr:methyl-accepting chemotaxis protein [Marinomonas sp. IMCC 4694]TYL48696.1 methyl-accepting chemotaxis protein [Marinomonas sp. IMCC 4694]